MTDYKPLLDEYLTLRHKVDQIKTQAKLDAGELNKRMAVIEAQITEAADAEGLDSIPTEAGTGYWTTLHTCKVSSPEDFNNYVRLAGAWQLTDVRASKTGVKEHIEEHGSPPPGVSFSSYRKFNVREARK